MSTRLLFLIPAIVFTLFLTSVVSPTLAQNPPAKSPADRSIDGLNQSAGPAGFTINADRNQIDQKINVIVAGIIRTLLGLTGVLFMGLVIFAGNLWMTAGGNEEQVSKARTMIVNAVIGIVAVFSAYIVTNYVVDAIVGFVTA